MLTMKPRKGCIMAETMKPIVILKKFFGFKANQTLQGFAAEIQKLSKEERLELARLAAVELGVEVDEAPGP